MEGEGADDVFDGGPGRMALSALQAAGTVISMRSSSDATSRAMAVPRSGAMAVEGRLEPWCAIGGDGLDPERALLDPVTDEVDGVGLGVGLVDLQRPNACGVVDRRVLVASHRTPPFRFNVRNFTSTCT